MKNHKIFLSVSTVLLFSVNFCGGVYDYDYGDTAASSYYKEMFHPDVIQDFTGNYYYKRLAAHPREMRIRHLKLNQYMWIRKDRQSLQNRVVLNYNNWETFYIHGGTEGKQLEAAYSDSTCLSAIPKKGYKLSTSICKPNNLNERWVLIPTIHGHFRIQQTGTNYCLQPAYDISFPTLIQMRPCDPYESHQLWDVSDAYLYY